MTVWPCCWRTSACPKWMASVFCRKPCTFPRMPSGLCSPLTPIPTRPSAPSTRSPSIFSFSSRGTRLSSFCIRNWMTCSMIGRLGTVRGFRGFACWARAGLRAPMNCVTFLRATIFLTSGLTWRLPPTIRKPSACWKRWGRKPESLPVVLFPDGTKLLESVPADVAQKVGLRTRAQTSFYDLAIIGGGPAGLAAAVYGASEGLHTVIVECDAPGGQAGMSSRIENYLGFPNGLSGGDLARRAVVQAQRFGVEILSPQEAVGVRTEGSYRIIKLKDGNEISCHALMIATGVQWRRLDAPGIDRLQGAGVYYGGGSPGALSCKGETVYVVGGANSAGQAAMNFSRYAERVVILVRGSSLASTMSEEH